MWQSSWICLSKLHHARKLVRFCVKTILFYLLFQNVVAFIKRCITFYHDEVLLFIRRLLPLSCFHVSSQWLFKVKITCKSLSVLGVYASCNFYYPSFLLWSIFSSPVDVQWKWLNPFCWAYPCLIFLRVN